ncbi:CRISPR-associated helicase Cas3' [Jejubacter calystegiae]|uniref:CRISPR-associated helicase Cas3 n=1 Tax=Jejubacter calystegiae TaxID=2579935 RepID=A0A4P8YEK0_9ENTR|nr:CRISPR-associated helicase Cas3' [Jejubacter calystegiae]QCT18166.1 CRISPR-associated helicase Cas3' [Jejubacter calystegiae]
MDLFYGYWGKTRQRNDNGGDDYHLLVWHSLDVAACGYQMVQQNIYGSADIFARLGISDRHQAAEMFGWLLCWHDIGKFARAFQRQYQAPELVADKPGVAYSGHHTALGSWLWQDKFRERASDFISSGLRLRKLQRILDGWMYLITAHHGKPVSAGNCLRAFDPDGEDIEAVSQFLLAASRLFPLRVIPENWQSDEWKAHFATESWRLSALVVLADWMGSNTRYFPRDSRVIPLEAYWQRALGYSRNAVSALPARSQVASFQGLRHLFPFIEHPTPLQELALKIDTGRSSGQLYIFEDVTGAGKTEAALVLAHRLMVAHNASGIYIALPTMATANAMYQRMYQTWRLLYCDDSRPSLILAHGARHLSELFSQSVWYSEATASDELADEAPSAEGCAAWFADSRKKALLAEVGVGTIDQALMAVMSFRHQNLRLLGLEGKILICDEIHAYDAFVGKLLEQLVEAHIASGGTVILLSATLSEAQRGQLLAAGQRARSGSPLDQSSLSWDYPLVTHLRDGQVVNHKIDTREEVQRRVSVDWLYSERGCLDKIYQAVEQGACICWIRNSVDDAIKVYRQLINEERIAQENIQLFHSRFAFCDRIKIETEVISRFGKNNNAPTLRQGRVLICSPVLEQSIDVDFDYMISDLAPVDLLIQRAGRLQRHIRSRGGSLITGKVDGRPGPLLTVLAPEWDDDPTADWLSAVMRNTAYIYPDHGCLWLTQKTLREHGEIHMPDAARVLVEAVYGDRFAVPKAFEKVVYSEAGKELAERSEAIQRVIHFEVGYNINSSEFWDEDNVTRLAGETLELYLAFRQQGELVPYGSGDYPWEMSMVRVRKSWWDKRQSAFSMATPEELERWRKDHRRGQGMVIVLSSCDEPCGYSCHTGLEGSL